MDFSMAQNAQDVFINQEESFRLRLMMTHKERFEALMGLIRIHRMIASAKIVHKKKEK
jgi:hypothetical protein